MALRNATSKTLERIRKEHGISQEQLSSLTGVSRSQIAMVEAGERFLKTNELEQIANALEVSPCYLLTGNSDENRQCSSADLGLSDETISRLRFLKRTNPSALAQLEMLINDDGSPVSKDGKIDLSFIGILEMIMSDENGIRIVDPDTGLQAPHKLKIWIGGNMIHPTDLRPLEMYQNKMIKRLAVIRKKYLSRKKEIEVKDDEES